MFSRKLRVSWSNAGLPTIKTFYYTDRNRLSEINIVPSVERMWNGLKADAMKMLKPAIIHSYRVTKTASPSARECLDIYTRPTTIDKFTGKV